MRNVPCPVCRGKRLNLLYSKNYMLSIHDVDDVYSVELNIPLS